MRIMLDTNILVSAIFFPSTQTRKLIRALSNNHRIILCDYVLEELAFEFKYGRFTPSDFT